MMDASLTQIDEADIAKHRATAQSLVTRMSVIEQEKSQGGVPIAGTGRRFVSPVSHAPTRRAKEIALEALVSGITGDDPMLSPAQHNVVYRARRGVAIGLAVADAFSAASGLDALMEKNRRAALDGEAAARFHALQENAAFCAAFALAAYLKRMVEAEGQLDATIESPNFDFDTPMDAIKSVLSGLATAIERAKDDVELSQGVHKAAHAALEDLLLRRPRFEALGAFAYAHISVEKDGFTLEGFDSLPGASRKPLVMQFKKPEEIIGNHIAKYQAIKLAKMLMAYDFERKMNPFVDLGGFIFTFIGDGAPGTGKTILIQMLAGLVHDYAQVAGYPFVYENFGADQISSYQGKSGQNCKRFITTVLDPNAIGLGTIDDIDQVAAKRSDDRASAGQQEVTAVLMESFAGASTVVRGNCAFGMFSNYPENVDDALRQRAGARWLVDGPQTEDDYIDIFALLAGKNHAIDLGAHDLFSAQGIQKAVATAYEGFNRPQEEALLNVYDQVLEQNGALETLADIGRYLHAIKLREPRFTGRAIKNITDAIKMRAMDIDLPDEWFEKPEVFMHRDYEAKKVMIAELRQPFTIEMVLQEINRYADSEFRYSDRSDAVDVERMIRNERLREKAATKIVELKNNGAWSV